MTEFKIPEVHPPTSPRLTFYVEYTTGLAVTLCNMHIKPSNADGSVVEASVCINGQALTDAEFGVNEQFIMLNTTIAPDDLIEFSYTVDPDGGSNRAKEEKTKEITKSWEEITNPSSEDLLI